MLLKRAVSFGGRRAAAAAAAPQALRSLRPRLRATSAAARTSSFAELSAAVLAAAVAAAAATPGAAAPPDKLPWRENTKVTVLDNADGSSLSNAVRSLLTTIRSCETEHNEFCRSVDRLNRLMLEVVLGMLLEDDGVCPSTQNTGHTPAHTGALTASSAHIWNQSPSTTPRYSTVLCTCDFQSNTVHR